MFNLKHNVDNFVLLHRGTDMLKPIGVKVLSMAKRVNEALMAAITIEMPATPMSTLLKPMSMEATTMLMAPITILHEL